MKLNLSKNWAFFLAALALVACDPPVEKGKTELKNQIRFGDDVYAITEAEQNYEGEMISLYLSAGDDVWTAFSFPAGENLSLQSGKCDFASEGSGKEGTFVYGAFGRGETEYGVVAGSVELSFAGDLFTADADCLCEDGSRLAIQYSGTLMSFVPTGTTTFTVDGRSFPVALVGLYDLGETESVKGLYCTGVGIYALSQDDTRHFSAALSLFHTEPQLTAGTYTWPSVGDKSVGGEFMADDEDGWDTGGVMWGGKIIVAISGDNCTITFEEVEFHNGIDAVAITGGYQGSVGPAVDLDVDFNSEPQYSGSGDLRFGEDHLNYLDVTRDATAQIPDAELFITSIYAAGYTGDAVCYTQINLRSATNEFKAGEYAFSAVGNADLTIDGTIYKEDHDTSYEGKITGGSLTIAESEGVYTITFDLTAQYAEGEPFPITGTYSGSIRENE